MWIEAIGQPFLYRWPGGEVHLAPGHPIDLPPDRAAKLLARGKVRVLENPRQVQVGVVVEWRGALFPNCQAEVLAIDDHGENFLVHHPRTETLCWLPVEWIVK
jgi:hypothetical protein